MTDADKKNMPEKFGKYTIKKVLGKGAMGIVYLGHDPGIDRTVAIKTILKDVMEQADSASEMLERFKREAQAAGRLAHPNIVNVYDYGEEDGSAYIAMEFVDGKELKDFFDKNDVFELKDSVHIITQVLAGLERAHSQGVVHRDIKPANIFLMADGSTVKIGDFGIARVESSNLTQAGTVMGTPSYMSPEQFMGQRVDSRADLFSVGVMLYQFLTNEKPFTGSLTTIMHKVLNTNPESPSALNFQVPEVYDAVVRKALAKKAQERFQSAAEFSKALNAAFNGESLDDLEEDDDEPTIMGQAVDDATVVAAAPPKKAKRKKTTVAKQQAAAPVAPAPAASNRGLIIGIAVALVILVVGGIGAWQFWPQRDGGSRDYKPDNRQSYERAPDRDTRPASSQQPGLVTFTSIPVGAVVFHGSGEFFGKTPLEEEVTPGSYEFIFRKEGYHDKNLTLDVEAGDEIPFDVELEKK